MTRIRQLREKRGFTQEELARLLGVSLDTVRRWERGSHVPQVRIRHRLAKRLGTSVEDLEIEEDIA